MWPGLNVCGPISETGVISAAVPVMKHFVNVFKFFRHDLALDHLDAARLGEVDHGAARDAVEEAVGLGRVDGAVLDEEDVGAGAFGDVALEVEHQRVGVAGPLGAVLFDGADHVEAGGLGAEGRGGGSRAAVLREGDADALQPLLHGEVGAPVPGGDREMDLVGLGGHAHHLAAAPGDGAHVAVGQVVGA